MEIRDYKLGDEVFILELFKEAFGKPLSMEYWKWRFLDNPLQKIMIKLMWDKDRLVGHYAVSPLKMIVNEEPVLTALSMTTMTHPEYAGKGIFTKLADALYEDGIQYSDLKAVWGFPNNNSHYAFINKLHWIELKQIPLLSLAIEKINNGVAPHILVAKSFRLEHVKAQKELGVNQVVKIDKSIEFLTWRYVNNPSNEYSIFELNNGTLSYYAVTKVFPSFSQKNKYEIDILELVFPADEELLNFLLIRIKEYYKEYDLLQINLWLSPNDSKFISIEKIGFLNNQPATYLGIRILDSKYDVMKESKEWYYSMGDSDIY